MRYLRVDARRKTPVRTRTRPEQPATLQSPRPRDHRHRTAFQRLLHAFHGPALGSERSDWCRQAFVCSMGALTTTGRLRCGLTDLGEGHPFTLSAGESALE